MAAVSVPNPAVPPAWRYAGDQLKRWRLKAGVTREELGRAARYSPDTIKAMEQGVRMPTPQLLDAADALCQAEGLLSAAAGYLRREKFPARAQDFMQREREARSLWWYEVALIPGLLQTEDHARALIGNHCPTLDEGTVEERVAARLERQSLLYGSPPVNLSFVLFEAALRCEWGGREAHREQLVRLLAMGELRNVSLQVLPFERVIPAAVLGPMVLLETREHERLAFTEGPSVSQLTADPEVVSSHTERLSMIRAESLGAEESALFIKRMVDQL
ncbi:helix-turn-helix transcriptional regulator [Streptomyces sp. APSN-46.1]|uniref:helix-turn-helix domain-containing protein n=1 Tax=Streptomyces sp. APSN-46.1 TaxID=2929049 RepID=UPI001FB39DE3|nr:helix-turn-helix transcriptional regulator [Streptomyces sp. APSN-46.1]MCJ1678370.1 helix-turn-helix transcriptional regulator [Streptomyces sp. APSN-46.1]